MAEAAPMLRCPYLGLRRFEAADARTFYGRDSDLELCLDQLLNPAVRVLVLHGLSGSGKSSFLRAGLMPRLVADARTSGSEGGVIPITGVVNAGQEMLRGLAQQAYAFVVNGESQERWDRQRLRLSKFGPQDVFADEVARRPETLIEFLADLSRNPRHVALLAIDQVEEYFTDPRLAEQDSQSAFFEIVGQFARERLNAKLVVSLRTEQYGMFASRLPLSAQSAFAGVRGLQRVFQHYLADPQQDELVSLVRAPASDPTYGFQFSPGAAEHIVGRLIEAAAGPEMSVLPLLQTVLLRLYLDASKAAASQGKPALITSSAFDAISEMAGGKGTGFIRDFVDWGLSQAIEEVTKLPAVSQQHWMEVSRWHEVLRGLSTRSPLGILVREKKTPADLKALARKEECRADPERMAATLSTPRIGLFSVDTNSCVTLQHDVVCLSFDVPSEIPALGFWRQSARNRRRRILNAAEYNIDHLFAHDRPTPQTVRVAELRFWDHKSLAYAAHLGLFARLGLTADVVPVEEDIKASSLCQKLQPTADAHAVFSYSRALMDIDELEESCDLVVLNSFAGYAMVCNRAAGATLHRYEEQEGWVGFERLCTDMLLQYSRGCRFEAEDEGAGVFLSHMFDIYRHRTTSLIDVSIEPRTSELAGVEFVKSLLDHQGPFVAVVTTPTWALADEEGMRTVIGQRALLGLLDYDLIPLDAHLTALRRKLEMRNVMNLKLGELPPNEDCDALKLRLLSVGLFVADVIWAQDREAGKWIRERWMGSAGPAEQRTSLPMFMRTFRQSCAYVTAQEHGRRYYGTAWDDDCPEALRLHQRWQEEQMSYERHVAALTTLQKIDADSAAPEVGELVSRARRHADIENYYDANRLMSVALQRLNQGRGAPDSLSDGEGR